MNRVWMKRILSSLLTLLLPCAMAAAAANDKDWQVPVLGVFRVPYEFMAAEFPDLKQMLESQKEMLDSQAEISIPHAREKLHPEQIDFAAYQLTMNDGQAYHLAWLLVLRDRSIMDSQDAMYFDQPLNIEQRVSMIMLQDTLRQNIDQMQYQDPMSGFGLKVLEFDQIALENKGPKHLYAAGVRLLVNYQKFLFPVYARGWVFSSDNRLAAVMLLCTDSERIFWTPMLNTVIATQRPLPPGTKNQ